MTVLSVCMPVYNCESTIERSVHSVLDQTYGEFECFVIDNNSSDSTPERVAAIADSRLRLIRNPANLGLVGNHNKCLQVGSGSLVQIVHGDDWLLPDCLAKLVPAFDTPSVGIAFARRRVDTDDLVWKRLYGRLDGPLQPLSPFNSGRELVRRYLSAGAAGNPIGEPTSVMVRRETLIAAGGFRAEAPQLQDIDAWMRVLSCSDAAFVDEELAVRWHHSDSETAIHGGTAVLDRLWVLADLIRCQDLDLGLRRHALALWVRSLVRVPTTLARAPRGEAAVQLKKLAANARFVMAGPPLRFCGGV